MRRIKCLVVVLLVFLLSGCMDASVNITIRNDDSGQIEYILGYEESFYESMEEETNDTTEENVPDAKVEDYTYDKGGKTYIGKKVTVTFDSLDKLNETLEKMNDDSEDEEGPPSVSSPILKASREGNNVTISLAPDKESYESSKMYLSYLSYSLKIKIDGKVINNNADSIDEKTNTYTWDVSTMLQEGVNLEYQAGYNYLILGAIAVIVVSIIVLAVIYIKLLLSKK